LRDLQPCNSVLMLLDTVGQNIWKSPVPPKKTREMNQFDRFLFRYFPFSESITFNFYRKYITTKKIVKLILKCIWFLKFFWPGHFKIIWPAMCPPLKQYFQVSFFPFCSPTGRLLKKMNHNFFFQCFFKSF